MTSHTRSAALLSILAAAGLVLTGCSSGGAGAGEPSPIRVGAVSSLTGPAPFPDVPAAAQAVFDRVNAEGGIDGRPIEFISEDDGADPAQAAQAARRLVDEEGVVALVGAASLVDCNANATLYEQRGVVSIMGTGVEPACFAARNIAPVNNGTIQGYKSLLYYASEDLGRQRVCPVILKTPGLTEPYLELIESWEQETGSTAAHIDTSVALGDDPTPAILAVRDADCDAVVFNSNEPVAVAFMNTVEQQGLLDSADWLTLSAAYTDSAIGALQRQGTVGLYVDSEFLPFTGDEPGLSDWRETLGEAGAPLTSLSMGGYVSAEILVEVLRGIDGDITRESVTEAFRSLDEIDNPLLGMPFAFGDADSHTPNRASRMVRATAQGWETVSDWVIAPE